MNPVSHQRHSIRVPGYDYSQPGAYFVTIVTKGRDCLLGEIGEGKMDLNAAGKIVWEVWNSLPSRYSEITLGTAAVMPNHFQGIIEISVGAIHRASGHQARIAHIGRMSGRCSIAPTGDPIIIATPAHDSANRGWVFQDAICQADQPVA